MTPESPHSEPAEAEPSRSRHPEPIALAEAEAILDATLAGHRMPIESQPLDQAGGRVLAQDLRAPMPLQPFDNAAMDGYAVRAADLDASSPTRLHLIGERFAGRSHALRITPGQCVRITTGAALPDGADTVVIRENSRVLGDWIELSAGTAPGANIRRAGEDLAEGEIALSAGQRLDPVRLGLAAALGFATLPVYRRPQAVVFASGDELRPAGQPLAAGEIHDSNGPMLAALLASDGVEVERGAILPDDPEQIRRHLDRAADRADVILTCGGVSAGDRDHLPAVLAAHGAIRFWRVRLKPGMPVLLGLWRGVPVLGLPGNPVSVLACYLVLGRRLLQRLQGCSEPPLELSAQLDAAIDKRHSRLEFRRGLLRCDRHGQLRVLASPAVGSHRLAAAARSNALIRLPEPPARFEAGQTVAVLPYGPLT